MCIKRALINCPPFLSFGFPCRCLFPRKRGLVSSLFVAGFTGCGIIFYILYKIFEDVGRSMCVLTDDSLLRGGPLPPVSDEGVCSLAVCVATTL